MHAAAAARQRRWQKPTFEANGFGGDELLFPQPQQARFSAAALDGVADGADQQRPVDLALDQVVLGARGDGVGAEALVVEAGEHADGGERIGREQRAQPLEARVPGEVEVEQHAVDVFEVRQCLGHRPGDGQRHVRVHFRDQFTDEERITRIVLDQQQPPHRLPQLAPNDHHAAVVARSTEVNSASPSVDGPVSGSTACSGCGINPTTRPSADATPAMSFSEPLGLPPA